MSIFDALQLAGGLILAVGYIPQIVQIVRTKSCADINLKTYIMMSIGIGMMEIYAVHLALGGTGLMFLATNSLSLYLALLICILILIVGKNKRKDTML